MANEKAFTLIEVIVCLVLIGIMAAIAGMGLVKIAEGYVFAKQNAETVQKAQIAIARVVKELGAATAISATPVPTATSITYTRPQGTGTVANTISLSGTTVQIQVVTATTTAVAPLIENATGFTLTYRDASGGLTTTLANIRRIDFAFTVSGANNTPIVFDNNTVFIQESY